MKNKIHSLIVEGVLFCGSGLGLLSYSLISYGKSFNKDWAQSPYLFPLLVGLAMTGLSIWLAGEGIQTMKKEAVDLDGRREAGNTKKPIIWGQISEVLIALVLCGIYYLLLVSLKIPYVTIGIFSFMYTFSTFEVATVIFLAAMMAFMGVRKLPILLLVPLGTTLFFYRKVLRITTKT